LGWPNVWDKVSVADGRECDDNKVRGLEQVEVAVASSLEVLHSTDARKN